MVSTSVTSRRPETHRSMATSDMSESIACGTVRHERPFAPLPLERRGRHREPHILGQGSHRWSATVRPGGYPGRPQKARTRCSRPISRPRPATPSRPGSRSLTRGCPAATSTSSCTRRRRGKARAGTATPSGTRISAGSLIFRPLLRLGWRRDVHLDRQGRALEGDQRHRADRLQLRPSRPADPGPADGAAVL